MKRLTRNDAIEAIRAKLLTLADPAHSMCETAGRRGIFCGGFSQWSTGALRSRHRWLLRGRPAIDREEIVASADRWQLERQRATGSALSCDVQADPCESHRTCSSWEGFSDPQIAAYFREMVGEDVEIVASTFPGSGSSPSRA